MTLEKRLQIAIKERGLVKSKIAKRLNISRPTLYIRLKKGGFTSYQEQLINQYFL